MFKSNNGGSVGGGIYFDLTANTDVTFTMFEMNFLTAAGTVGSVDVYTRPGTSMGFEMSMTGWTLVGSANVVASGESVPSIADFASSTMGPITLTQGSYGVAICANGLGHAYTNGNGANEIASNHELTFTGRTAQNMCFSSTTLFSPRVPSIAFHYTVPSGWATANPYGAGCVEQTSSFYERFAPSASPAGATFDLDASVAGNVNVLRMIYTNPGYVVLPAVESPMSAANWFTPTSANLAMADDEIRPLTLPFGFPWEGDPTGASTTTIYLSSNGFIMLSAGCTGGFACSNGHPTLEDVIGPPFTTGMGSEAKLMFLWADHDPTRGGSIHFDTTTNEAFITFLNIEEWLCSTCLPNNPGVTVQVRLDSTGSVEYRYQQADNVNWDAHVGYTPGSSQNPNGARPRRVDISALSSPLVSLPDLAPLSLVADARPVLGTTFNLVPGDVPSGATVGILGFSFSQQPPPGIDLSSLGLTGCRLHIGSGLGGLAATLITNPTMATPLMIPNSTAFAGLQLFTQVATDGGATTAGLVTSNGLDATVEAQ